MVTSAAVNTRGSDHTTAEDAVDLHRGPPRTAVSPGLVAREGLEADWPEGLTSWQDRAPVSSLVQPASVASPCVCLAGAEAVTGQDLVIDAGISVGEDCS